MCAKYVSILKTARLGNLGQMARRVAGLQYLSDKDFLPEVDETSAARLRDLSRHARGDGPTPIIVLGVMPRSGSNMIRDVLALHPDVAADPGRLYEFPLLHAADGAAALMEEFISYFPRNADVLGRYDALAMLAGAWLRELQREAGNKRILLKCPHVQHLSLAPHIFPDAKLVLCLRDGRDVVDSSLNTFSRYSLSRKTFAQLATEWKLGTDAMMQMSGASDASNVLLNRFEDIMSEPRQTVDALLAHTGLDPATYDYDGYENLPVRGSSRNKTDDDTRWQPQEKSKDFKPVDRWLSWSDKRKAQFDKIAGAALERAGYRRHV